MTIPNRILPILIASIAATACGEKPVAEMANSSGAAAPQAVVDQGKNAAPAVSIPQIAYAYTYGFSLPTDRVAAAQNAHMALCDRMGPTRCHILDMQRTASDNGYGAASLSLEVESRSARTFGASLTDAVTGAGGSQTDSNISAEDLSKKIVDTQARLRSKELLAARLTELLQSRKGSVAELVEAERSVATVQEEIDEARSWLAEMRGRVSMSKIDISYSGSGSRGFLAPLKSSFATMGQIAGTSLGLLVQLVAIVLPWALLAAAILLLKRRFGARIATLFRRDQGPD